MVELEYCNDCDGWGHHKHNCKCKSDVDFVVGCCKTCCGGGTIRKKKPTPKKLIPKKLILPFEFRNGINTS